MPVLVACLWLLVLAGAGATVDVVRGDHPAVGFGIGLLLSSVLVALRVRRSELVTGVVAPPVAGAFVVAVALVATEGVRSVRNLALVLATQLALLAPWLWLATGVATVIILTRRLRR